MFHTRRLFMQKWLFIVVLLSTLNVFIIVLPSTLNVSIYRIKRGRYITASQKLQVAATTSFTYPVIWDSFWYYKRNLSPVLKVLMQFKTSSNVTVSNELNFLKPQWHGVVICHIASDWFNTIQTWWINYEFNYRSQWKQVSGLKADLGASLVWRRHLVSIRSPIIKIRLSHDPFIFILEILIHGKNVFILRRVPWWCFCLYPSNPVTPQPQKYL